MTSLGIYPSYELKTKSMSMEREFQDRLFNILQVFHSSRTESYDHFKLINNSQFKHNLQNFRFCYF